MKYCFEMDSVSPKTKIQYCHYHVRSVHQALDRWRQEGSQLTEEKALMYLTLDRYSNSLTSRMRANVLLYTCPGLAQIFPDRFEGSAKMMHIHDRTSRSHMNDEDNTEERPSVDFGTATLLSELQTLRNSDNFRPTTARQEEMKGQISGSSECSMLTMQSPVNVGVLRLEQVQQRSSTGSAQDNCSSHYDL